MGLADRVDSRSRPRLRWRLPPGREPDIKACPCHDLPHVAACCCADNGAAHACGFPDEACSTCEADDPSDARADASAREALAEQHADALAEPHPDCDFAAYDPCPISQCCRYDVDDVCGSRPGGTTHGSRCDCR